MFGHISHSSASPNQEMVVFKVANFQCTPMSTEPAPRFAWSSRDTPHQGSAAAVRDVWTTTNDISISFDEFTAITYTKHVRLLTSTLNGQ
jgi:hypothetical protein